MQLVQNISKLLLVTALSSGLLFTWYFNNVIAPRHVDVATQGSIFDIDIELPSPLITQLTPPTPIAVALDKPVVNAAEPKKPEPKVVQTASIWKALRSDLKLDHRVESAQVKKEIRKILAEGDKLGKILQASGPYIHYIYQQVQARHLPAELALIPVIESEFNPHDFSHKGATGLWQLMRGTASQLGVKVTSGYDGRKNVVASTRAALVYFNDLGKLFKGNWYLAIAAYNSGQGRVLSAMRRTGSQSVWHLPLPRETQIYVPKLLAVAAIVKNPQKYGVVLPHIDDEPYFAEIKTKKYINLEKVAKTSGAPLKVLNALNPDYKHGNVVPKNGAYSLLVPLNVLAEVKQFLAADIIPH